MPPESVSCGAIPENPANPIRARNWQGPSVRASAGRVMLWPRKGSLRISNTNIFTVSIRNSLRRRARSGRKFRSMVRVQRNYAIACNQELSRMVFGGPALINGR
jgi:hypothetical protein